MAPQLLQGPEFHVDEVGLGFVRHGRALHRAQRRIVFTCRGERLFPVACIATAKPDGPLPVQPPTDDRDARALQSALWRMHLNNLEQVAAESSLSLQLQADLPGAIDLACIDTLIEEARAGDIPLRSLTVDVTDVSMPMRGMITNRLRNCGARTAMTIEAASQFTGDHIAQPDIIRIAAPWFVAWGKDRTLARLLGPTVALLHRRGSSVQIEGIATIDHVRVAIDAGAAYLQGDLLEREAPVGVPFEERSRPLDRYLGSNIVRLFG